MLVNLGRSWPRWGTRKTWKVRPPGTSGDVTEIRSVRLGVHSTQVPDVWISVLWQGERGPPGNNGDKGERGDDVSVDDHDSGGSKRTSMHRLTRCCLLRVPGSSGARWTSWRESKYDRFDAEAERSAEIHLNACKILYRDQLERKESKVPVGTEVHEESR